MQYLMSNQQQIITLNIDTWVANSAGLSHHSDWQNWAREEIWPDDNTLNTDHIPPMMRRRMSSLSKLAVQTALTAIESQHIDYMVFSCRHGELHRSVEIVKSILIGEEASPMAFSQSVHNTAAGLATIASKQPIPLTSIAAAQNTFQSAILEAWLYLNEHPSHKVLLVDFDEPLPSDYQQYEEWQFQGYALGLTLSHGSDFTLSMQMSDTKPQQPQALSFLHHYLSEKSEWIIEGSQSAWKWQRKC